MKNKEHTKQRCLKVSFNEDKGTSPGLVYYLHIMKWADV